jgi:hypothetical protein
MVMHMGCQEKRAYTCKQEKRGHTHANAIPRYRVQFANAIKMDEKKTVGEIVTTFLALNNKKNKGGGRANGNLYMRVCTVQNFL